MEIRQSASEGAGPATEQPDDQVRALRRDAYLTAGIGVAFALLYFISYWLLTSTPGVDAPAEEIESFYASVDRRRVTLAGLYLMPFSGIAFIWFTVALRTWMSGSARGEGGLPASIQLVSGILYVGLSFAAAAAFATAAAGIEFADAPVEPAAARQLALYGRTLLLVFAMRMAAMYIFTTSAFGRSAGILPRWFTYGSYAFGLLLLFGVTYNRLLVLSFPVWVLLLCLILLNWARRHPDTADLSRRVATD